MRVLRCFCFVASGRAILAVDANADVFPVKICKVYSRCYRSLAFVFKNALHLGCGMRAFRCLNIYCVRENSAAPLEGLSQVDACAVWYEHSVSYFQVTTSNHFSASCSDCHCCLFISSFIKRYLSLLILGRPNSKPVYILGCLKP